MSKTQPKIVVLDDDPTGSQTVHSCLLLMQWDLETLKMGLQDEVPIFFILTNTRAIALEKAKTIVKEVCQNLKQALTELQITNFLVVSRSDSTLRGHYPLETDAIAEELGHFDAHFLTPAFFEGGRITKNSIHYLLIEGVLTPVHETEFAKDSVFSYSHSYLPDYVAEKTQGQITADRVVTLQLNDLRSDRLISELLKLNDNQCVAVDGETQADFDLLAGAILETSNRGKRFLFRSAASLLTSLAQLGTQPVSADSMATYKPTNKPGVVLVGSHVSKTTKQLQQLLIETKTTAIEVDVVRLRDDPLQRNNILQETLDSVLSTWQQGQTPVVYTSREELNFANIQQRLDFGVEVSNLLMDVVRGLPPEISFLISKGGITSNDVLSTGLKLKTSRLLGQILPGVSVVKTPENHPQFPNLPVVLFPGNVGSDRALVEAWESLSK
jgi:uncharacterized protein YgbK (DUF1537 family)